MISHPLALSNVQMQIIRDHAKAVPTRLRTAYLNDVMDRLMPLTFDQIDDDCVLSAATLALNRWRVK